MVGNPPIHDSNDHLHVELQSREVNLVSRAQALPDTEQPASFFVQLERYEGHPSERKPVPIFCDLFFTVFCGSLKQSCIHHKSGQ